MLKLFEVTGFKNFDKTIQIDFSDVRDYHFNDCCISNQLLSKIIVYGKNSVGKSNLGLAVFDIVSHMTSNHVGPGLYDYYLNVNNKAGYAQFHYVFEFGKDIVDYQYKKNEKQILIYETVSINHERLFEYDYEKKKGDLSALQKLTTTLNLSFRGNDSILKYVIANTQLEENHPLYLMQKYVSHMLWFRSLDENRYIGYKSDSKDYYDFILKDNRLKQFEAFLNQAGIPEKLIIIKDADGSEKLYFNTKKPLPFFKAASSGTKALYTFFYWYETAADVSMMFIDEFDAFYHYELSETIVKMLEKTKNSQVILTSHNTNLLSNRIMRPDCYFILTGEKLTSFANATDRELREGHNLEKLYMSGEFNE